MTGPYMGPTPASELARQAAESSNDLAQHQASYAAARQANAERARYASVAPDVNHGTVGKYNTATTIAAGAMFLAGYYVLPPGRPRRMYLLTFAFFFASGFTSDWDHPAADDGLYLFTGAPTTWSWLLWAAAFYCFTQLIGEIRNARRQYRQQR